MIWINEVSSPLIKPYGLFALAAAAAGMILLLRLLKNYRESYRILPKIISVVSISVMLTGVSFGYIIEVLKNVFNGIPNIFIVKGFGFVAYGGIIGALAAAYFAVCRYRLDKYLMMDSLSCIIPIVHGIARAGCLFSGCCYGKEYHGFLSVYYASRDMYCFPFQIAEGAMDIILGVFLIYLYRKNNNSGRIMYLYLLIYSVCRFILEFFRGDEVRGVFMGVSSSQYISIGVFIFAVANLIMYYRRIKTYE